MSADLIPVISRRPGVKFVRAEEPGDKTVFVQIGSKTLVLVLNPRHPVRIIRQLHDGSGKFVIEEFDGHVY